MIGQLFTHDSLTARIGIGKAIGLIFGLLGFFLLPAVYPQADLMMRWGLLFWYPTVGAMVGVFGVYSYHPVLKMPLPWWFRAPWIGGWMNFVLTFFVFEEFRAILAAFTGGMLTSPFWFVLEGAIIGLIIGWTATRFAGEGPSTIETPAE